MDDLERQRQRRAEAMDLALDNPNCPRCLTRMEPTEAGWVCADCGKVVSPV